MKSSKIIIFELFLFFILVNFVSWGQCSITSFQVSPEDPVQGEDVTFTVTGIPNEKISANITFKQELAVNDRNYLWAIQEVNIPTLPNSFTVRARDVDLLRVTVKISEIPVTKSSTGTNHIAKVTQNNVPIGIYRVDISGIAANNASRVQITVSAFTEFTLDKNGFYTYSYSTEYLPSGDFNIKIGDLFKTINLNPNNETSIDNLAPVLVLDLPMYAYVEEQVSLSCSESYDLDGEIVDFIWDINGSKYYGKEILINRSLPGKYIVSITVVDNGGLQVEEEHYIYILDDENIEGNVNNLLQYILIPFFVIVVLFITIKYYKNNTLNQLFF